METQFSVKTQTFRGVHNKGNLWANLKVMDTGNLLGWPSVDYDWFPQSIEELSCTQHFLLHDTPTSFVNSKAFANVSKLTILTNKNLKVEELSEELREPLDLPKLWHLLSPI